MKFKNKSKLFYNYLFSYIIILLVPLVILGIFIYTFFLNLLKEEALVNNTNVLYRAQNVIETQLDNLSDVSSQISVNKNLKYFYLKDGIKDAIITINELNNYIVMNSFVEELLYYNRNDDFLYTSNTSSSLPLFLNSIYKYENWQIEDFTHDINNTKYPTCRPMENIILSDDSKKRVLTYIYPISSNNFEFDRTLCFIIPEKSFSTLLNDAVKEYSGVSMILDENNNVITSNGPITFDNHILKESLNFGETNFNKKITIENKKYLFSIVKSEKNSWKYVTFISNYNIMKNVNTTTLIFGIILLLVVFIGIAIIYYMMSLNYRPIKKLKLFTQEFSTDDYSSINEIDAVRSTIQSLSTKNNKLDTQLKNNSNATKDYLMSKIINGKISNMDEISAECANVGLVFDKTYFRIAVLYIKDLNSNNADAIINTITSDLLDELTIYAKTQTGNDNIILLISYNEDDTYINERIMTLHKKLKYTTNQLITFGVGNSTTNLNSISKSYIEAMTALDYRLIKGTDKIIFFDEIQIKQFNLNAPVNFMADKLRTSIKEGDIDKVKNIIDDTISFLKESNTSITVARLLCFDIINTVVKAMSELSRKKILSNEIYPDVFSLSEFETVDELSEIVQKISVDIYNFLNTNDKTDTLIDKILEYTNNACCHCDFTIQQVANQFKMLSPNLSQYFKEQTGYNIIDYCTELKIEKSKELLSYTSLPLKEIALQVGYYNVTSFIRRFKQITGVPPGEYRKNTV